MVAVPTLSFPKDLLIFDPCPFPYQEIEDEESKEDNEETAVPVWKNDKFIKGKAVGWSKWIAQSIAMGLAGNTP